MNSIKNLLIEKETLQNGLWMTLLIILMTMAFSFNIFNKNDNGFFDNFQKDSESLVIGKILADKFDIKTGNSGLGFISSGKFEANYNKIIESFDLYSQSKSFTTDADWIDGISRHWAGFYVPYSINNENYFKAGSRINFKNGDTKSIIRVEKDGNERLNIYLTGEKLSSKDVGRPFEFKKIENGTTVPQFDYWEYLSSYGAQGRFFSFLYNVLGIESLSLFRLFCAALLSIVLVLICYFLIKPFGFAFSVIFYIVFLFSPSVTSFARNLYWIPFTWFLPLLISLLILRKIRFFMHFLPLMFFAVFLKCLCGYEYITTIMLSSISILVISFFTTEDNKYRKQICLAIIAIGLTSLLAFFSALLIHANIRGDSILKGLTSIWKEDVLRRTIGGNPADFPPGYKPSLEATFFTVIRMYIFNWNTDVIHNFRGQTWFPFLLFSSLIIIIYSSIKKQKNHLSELVMYLVFLATTVSWFILGKAHSYIHTQLNIVLWNFGFIQCTIFIIFKFFKGHLINILAKIRYFHDSL